MSFLLGLITILLSSTVAHTTPSDANKMEVKFEGESIIDHEFSLKYKGLVTAFDTVPLFVLPNQKITFDILFPYKNDSYSFYNGKEWREVDKNLKIEWQAPNTPGHTTLKLRSEKTKHQVSIQTFIKIPASKMQEGKIERYKIGRYPSKKKARYVAPDGYIKVTEDTQTAKLTPSFRLGEFPSKQSADFPKYVFIRETLVLKLEALKRGFIDDGIEVDRIVVMSGYRTPYYNKKIGNVSLSRHVFGDAADIFIDNNGDYRMDDLTGDNKSNYQDAVFLADKVEEMAKREWYKPYIGGLGLYGPKPHRGPFIHVDTRGIRARWYQP